MIFSRQQLKPFKLPDTFTHMFGFFTLQLYVKTIWYFEFSSDRNGPCWTTKWKWSMKPFCHHINFYFTVEEEGWPPCGEKIKDGVSKQMEVWKGNRGLQIMVTMGWDGMGWSPGVNTCLIIDKNTLVVSGGIRTAFIVTSALWSLGLRRDSCATFRPNAERKFPDWACVWLVLSFSGQLANL